MPRHVRISLPKWYEEGWRELDDELRHGIIDQKTYKRLGRELEEELEEWLSNDKLEKNQFG
jgi:hypothetical protein